MIVVIKKSAIKDFKKISEPFKTQIKKAVQGLENYPDVSNIKRLTNFQPLYRMRVGNYRVLFDIEDNTIFVARIRHRKEVY